MRLGVDVGGTKIEIAALGDSGRIEVRERVDTPRGDYQATVGAIANLVGKVEARIGAAASVGVGIPGTISRATGLVKNANSTWLIGKPLDRDLEAALGRKVRLANDANCFALSEATDGAARGGGVVFGAILGTGIGGGVVVHGRILGGSHGIAGEWGHNPLPAPRPGELPGAKCYCGRYGCIEAWCSGPAFSAQFRALSGRDWTPSEIAATAGTGDASAKAALDLYMDRLARALGSVVNVIDPDIIVLGGGVSNIRALYDELPERVAAYAFSPEGPVTIVKNLHGDSSGVRGAAWLWSKEDAAQGLPR
jgi:fructokinase